jgi:hypothetical protein
MSTEIKDQTSVTEVSASEIDALFSIGAETAMLPDEKKPTVFSQLGVDTSFLDNPPKVGDDNDDNDGNPSPVATSITPASTVVTSNDDPLAMPNDDNQFDDDDKNKGGRPAAFVTAAKKLIEKKILLPFDDGKKIEDYTAADYEELIEANFQRTQEELQNQLPAQFFSNMPTEMQQAYSYIANGGTDLKSLFQAMGQANEIREISIDNEPGQIYAVRSYLQATNYGTADEIEDEIQSLMDRGDLEKKATQFKPKLDNMQQQMVNQRLAMQAQANQQRQAQSQAYMENIYNTLAKGEVSGIKLDERTQSLLYSGLVQPNYSSTSGKQTNLLGHLLEKYQWVEPNHDLIAETLWLLADPDGYKSEIRRTGEAAATAAVVRKLKTEQSNLSSSSTPDDEPANNGMGQRQAIPRPKKNFFAR